MLRAEGRRVGFDVKQHEFHEFSSKLAIMLELVYAGALPLDDIAFEAAGGDEGTPGAPAPETPPEPTPSADP